MGDRVIKAATAIGFAIVMASGTMAWAQSSPERDPVNRADMQCMALMAAGASMMEDGSQEQLGLAAAMAYYLGRLEARAPTMNWLDAFGTYLLSDFERDAKAQADRCGTEMMAFSARMISWSEKMQTLGAKGTSKQGQKRQHRP